MRTPFLLALACTARLLCGQSTRGDEVRSLGPPANGILRGAALSRDGDAVYAWGSGGVIRQELEAAGGNERAGRLRLRGGPGFGEGGCAASVKGEGSDDLILEERPAKGSGLGKLVWLEAPSGTVHELDSGIEMSDCLETALVGHRGILMVQRHAQVRFYPYPLAKDGHAAYQEVYSFYTASREAGLARADVDGDGREDIFCGNYWIQSPAEYTLPWHLFAIELYNQEEQSANLRLALPGGNGRELVVAQRRMQDAKVALLRVAEGADPKALWVESLLAAPGGFHNAAGLAVVGGRIYIGERNGRASRLLEFARGDEARGSYTLVRARASPPVVALLAAKAGVLVISEHGVGRLRRAGQ